MCSLEDRTRDSASQGTASVLAYSRYRLVTFTTWRYALFCWNSDTWFNLRRYGMLMYENDIFYINFTKLIAFKLPGIKSRSDNITLSYMSTNTVANFSYGKPSFLRADNRPRSKLGKGLNTPRVWRSRFKKNWFNCTTFIYLP